MHKYYLSIIWCFCFQSVVWATHYRAGEITYRQLTGRLYEITVNTYTDPRSNANPNTQSLTVNWGDNSPLITVQRQGQPIRLSEEIQLNIYVSTHQYQTDGTFRVSITDPNRVDNILNINRGFTEQLAFYIESIIFINSSIQNNTSPVLLNPPIDDGCVGFLYVHNPGAADPDGDSLVYRIIPPKIGANIDAPLYVDPFNSDSFEIDPVRGTVFWANPIQPGYYNIAIEIIELRNGIPVGAVTRDMQIRIFDCPNSPPTIPNMPDGCVKVGDNFTRTITATDINSTQLITLIPVGAPFEQSQSPATQTPEPAEAPSVVNAQFNWRPVCLNIRNQPHYIQFKASDNFSPRGTFVNGFFLKVNGPEPKNVRVEQIQRNALRVSWSPDECGLATQFLVYKRIDSSRWSPGPCETGVPASTGFRLVKTILLTQNPNDTFFIDDDNGNGLSPLVNYCYRIVAVYPNRNQTGLVIGGRVDPSYSSVEVCGTLIRSKPILTQVSVERTDIANGVIRLSYIKPDTLDTVFYGAPYRIAWKRRQAGETAFQQLGQFTYPNFASISDTMWFDSLLDTRNNQWEYQLDFFSNTTTTEKFVDESALASSVYTNVYASDRLVVINWLVNVPWLNDSFLVFRRNSTQQFEQIGVSTSNLFVDTGLVNGQTYCYRIQSVGAYSLLPLTIRNFSQEICATPVDTIPPCPPTLSVKAPCDDFSSFSTQLTWTPNISCSRDVALYRVYFRPNVSSPYQLLATLPASQLSYTDSRDSLKFSIAGCYLINGVDTNGNESFNALEQCIDNCPVYVIPNVFTPNIDDNVNSKLLPFDYRFVNRIDLSIYNRWGNLVFSTINPDIEWDGTDFRSGNGVADGVYYYTCDVYERYLDGERIRKLNGTIHIIR